MSVCVEGSLETVETDERQQGQPVRRGCWHIGTNSNTSTFTNTSRRITQTQSLTQKHKLNYKSNKYTDSGHLNPEIKAVRWASVVVGFGWVVIEYYTICICHVLHSPKQACR